MRCLEKDPNDRYESMSALRAALEDGDATPAASETGARSRSFALPAAAAAIAVSLVVAGSLWAPSQAEREAEPAPAIEAPDTGDVAQETTEQLLARAKVLFEDAVSNPPPEAKAFLAELP